MTVKVDSRTAIAVKNYKTSYLVYKGIECTEIGGFSDGRTYSYNQAQPKEERTILNPLQQSKKNSSRSSKKGAGQKHRPGAKFTQVLAKEWRKNDCDYKNGTKDL